MSLAAGLWYVLWLAGPTLQVFLVVVMLRRRLRREFPLFFAYTVFQVLSFGLKFAAYHHSQLEYFYVYWVSGALAIALGFAVIYEIFAQVFKPYEALRGMASVLFRWTALVLIGVAVVMALAGSRPEASLILGSILTFERSVRVMQCGLVLFLFLFARYVGISWRHHLFGIAAGFGIYAALDLILVTAHAAGFEGYTVLPLIKSFGYLFSILIWTGYMLSREPGRRPALYPTAERWNYALSGAQSMAGEMAFMPRIEDAVDRAFAKSNGKSNGNGHS